MYGIIFIKPLLKPQSTFEISLVWKGWVCLQSEGKTTFTINVVRKGFIFVCKPLPLPFKNNKIIFALCLLLSFEIIFQKQHRKLSEVHQRYGFFFISKFVFII